MRISLLSEDSPVPDDSIDYKDYAERFETTNSPAQRMLTPIDEDGLRTLSRCTDVSTLRSRYTSYNRVKYVQKEGGNVLFETIPFNKKDHTTAADRVAVELDKNHTVYTYLDQDTHYTYDKVVEAPERKIIKTRIVRIPVERIVEKERKIAVKTPRTRIVRVISKEKEKKVEVLKVPQPGKVVRQIVEVPTIVEKVVEKVVEKKIRVEVPVERIVEKKVYVDRIVEVPVERIVEVPVTVEVEKRVEVAVPYRVEVPVDRVVERRVEVPVPVDRERIVERTVTVSVSDSDSSRPNSPQRSGSVRGILKSTTPQGWDTGRSSATSSRMERHARDGYIHIGNIQPREVNFANSEASSSHGASQQRFGVVSARNANSRY